MIDAKPLVSVHFEVVQTGIFSKTDFAEIFNLVWVKRDACRSHRSRPSQCDSRLDSVLRKAEDGMKVKGRWRKYWDNYYSASKKFN